MSCRVRFRTMIVWLNGTFGVGKTTTAREICSLVPTARIFDTEHVGYMLQHVLASVPVDDFQDWRPWRGLVVESAVQILDFVGGMLVVPQSVLVERYWQEIRAGLDKAGVAVRHVLLHADRDAIARRIDADTAEAGARQWRHDHLDAYEAARPWLAREAEVIDTTDRSPGETAAQILAGPAPASGR
jgi:gluconate kinase